jgi:predicted RNase H-like nuclease (RuvC/YqgF family)
MCNGENKENKISDVDNVGKGANKEIKSTIELCDFKNMNESKGSNNDKGNEENSININRQKNLLMNLIIESNVPFVFMFIQNLVGYEKVQERTKQNLQKEIQDMKEKLANQKKENEEKMANQKKEMQEEMEKKLLTQKKEMQEEMDKKIEELNKKFVTFMNEMKKSTSQTMNTNEQTTDNVKK